MSDEQQQYGPQFADADIFRDEFEPIAEAPLAAEPAPAPQRFERVIDLQDGSGVQRFEGASQEELIDKLVQAQTHATQKIQQLSREREYAPAPQRAPAPPPFNPATAQLTADEEFALGQQLAQRPLETLRRLAPAVFGADATTIQNAVRAQQEQKWNEMVSDSVDDFLARHDARYSGTLGDYLPTSRNEAMISGLLEREGLPPSAPNLEYAFAKLSVSGLLETPAQQQQTVSPSTQVATGLSDRMGTSAPQQRGGRLTVEEAERMTPQQLRERILAEEYALGRR